MKKVIFVDDSEAILATMRFITEDLVENKEIEVETYSDPKKFLEKITKNEISYDVLFVDINMPQMTGLELVEELNKIEKNNGKIIALTTENSSDMKKKGREIKIAGWIVKPIPKGRIEITIRKLLKLQ